MRHTSLLTLKVKKGLPKVYRTPISQRLHGRKIFTDEIRELQRQLLEMKKELKELKGEV